MMSGVPRTHEICIMVGDTATSFSFYPTKKIWLQADVRLGIWIYLTKKMESVLEAIHFQC